MDPTDVGWHGDVGEMGRVERGMLQSASGANATHAAGTDDTPARVSFSVSCGINLKASRRPSQLHAVPYPAIVSVLLYQQYYPDVSPFLPPSPPPSLSPYPPPPPCLRRAIPLAALATSDPRPSPSAAVAQSMYPPLRWQGRLPRNAAEQPQEKSRNSSAADEEDTSDTSEQPCPARYQYQVQYPTSPATSK